MGRLILPESGLIYLDANCFIYSVEHIEPYSALLAPVWRRGGIVTSELTRLEVLVKPFEAGDEELSEVYRQLLNAREIECVPLSAEILEEAARLRAATGIKTPDAIHAASSLARNAGLFLSNDKRFRNFPSLPFAYLRDHVGG